jgi:hypothetical protein
LALARAKPTGFARTLRGLAKPEAKDEQKKLKKIYWPWLRQTIFLPNFFL